MTILYKRVLNKAVSLIIETYSKPIIFINFLMKRAVCWFFFKQATLPEYLTIYPQNKVAVLFANIIEKQYRMTHTTFIFDDEVHLIDRTILFRNSLRNQQRFNMLKSSFKGQRCMILDNSPDIDLVAAVDEFSIGIGNIFQETQKVGFVPSIIFISDIDVIKNYRNELLEIEDSDIFLPVSAYGILPQKENIYYLNMYQDADYCDEIVRYISLSEGENYAALQIADFFGFEKTGPRAKIRHLPKMIAKDSKEQRIIVSVNPCLQEMGGHYLALDDILFEESGLRNIPCFSLAHKDCAVDLIDYNHHIYPVFSQTDHAISCAPVRKAEVFYKELSKALSLLNKACGDNTKIILFMYSGSTSAARAIRNLLEDYQNIEAHIHLFFNSFPREHWSSKAYKRNWDLSGITHDRLYLYSGVEPLKNILSDKGVRTSLLPYFSTTFKDREIKCFHEKHPFNKQKETLEVLFPGVLRIEKGRNIITQAINSIIKKTKCERNIQIIVRVSKNDRAIIKNLKKISNVKILTGVLSANDYKNMIKSSDIIVNPYSGRAFANRPSGVFTDSMLLGIPVVSSSSSSMGKEIIHFDNGTVFDDDDAESLASAVVDCITYIDKYQNRAQEIAKKWYIENCWDAFMERLG